MSRALPLLVLLAAGACRSAPQYGGDGSVEVRLVLDPPEAAATPAPSDVEGWVIDSEGWVEIDGKRNLPRLHDLRRRGLHAEADELLLDLLGDIERLQLVHVRGIDSIAWLPKSTLFLIAHYDGRLPSIQFDSSTQRYVALPL